MTPHSETMIVCSIEYGDTYEVQVYNTYIQQYYSLAISTL